MFRSFSENQLLIGRAENILGRKVGSFDKNGDFEMDRQILTPEKPEKMADYTKVIKSDQPTYTSESWGKFYKFFTSFPFTPLFIPAGISTTCFCAD